MPHLDINLDCLHHPVVELGLVGHVLCQRLQVHTLCLQLSLFVLGLRLHAVGIAMLSASSQMILQKEIREKSEPDLTRCGPSSPGSVLVSARAWCGHSRSSTRPRPATCAQSAVPPLSVASEIRAITRNDDQNKIHPSDAAGIRSS